MSDYAGIGKAVESLFYGGFILLIIFVPLGLWKFIEILVYIFKHIHIF